MLSVAHFEMYQNLRWVDGQAGQEASMSGCQRQNVGGVY